MKIKKILFALSIVFFIVSPSFAAEKAKDKVKLEDSRIIGEIPEERMNLGETEIIGRVEAPQTALELPWSPPNFLNLSVLNPLRSFDTEIKGNFSGIDFFKYKNNLLRLRKKLATQGK